MARNSRSNTIPSKRKGKLNRDQLAVKLDCVPLLFRVAPKYARSVQLGRKVEMLFAHLKRYIGVPMMRLRGPKGAYEQFQLAATAQNLRKLAKLVPQPKPTG